MTEELEANEVRKVLDKIEYYTGEHTEGISYSVESFMQEAVEQGNLFSGSKLTSDLSLTYKERISGERTQDMTAIFVMGVMLGSALERDIPAHTELEEKWRNGEFKLPNND